MQLRCSLQHNVADNEPCQDLGILKMIKLMLLLGQIGMKLG